MRKEILPCTVCGRKFSAGEVGKAYFPSTGVCRNCYQEMQKLPHETNCFGKKTVRVKKRMRYGFNPRRLPCRSVCPDREICALFVAGKL